MIITGIAVPINAQNPNSQIEEIWNLVGREILTGKLELNDRDFLGLRMFFASSSMDRYIYLAGTSLVENEKTPQSFVQKNIPGLDYVCFKLPEKPSTARFIRKYVYHSWWPKITNAPLATFEIEFFPSFPDRNFERDAAPFPKALYFPLTFNSFNN